MAVDEVTVLQASQMLGIKVGSVRKAVRQGRIIATRRMGNAQRTWSFLLLDRESVERYRDVHLGRVGAASTRCTVCGERPGDAHPADHTYSRDPRIEEGAEA